MKLNKPVKILVGVGTACVIIYPLLFMAVWFSLMSGMLFSESVDSPFPLSSGLNFIFPLQCLFLVMYFILVGFYLIHIIKNRLVSDLIRGIFSIGLFFVPFIAMPVYCYFFILRSTPPQWALPKLTQPAQTPTGDVVPPAPSNPPVRTGLSPKKKAMIGGGIGVSLVIFFGLIFLYILFINRMSQSFQNQFFATSTPVHYDAIATYPANEKPFYQPVETTLFTPINTFKDVYMWRYYNQIPMLINHNNLIMAGYLHKLDDVWSRDINQNLISADLSSGQVTWQAVTGGMFLLKDAQRLYAEAPRNYGPAGLAAFDLATGRPIWEMRFDAKYGVGIDHLTLSANEIQAETYNHGYESRYTLDKATGKVKSLEKGISSSGKDEVVLYDDLKFEKRGYGIPDQIKVTRAANGSVLWTYGEELIVSNIAVGGPVTYLLTKNNHLIALETQTGRVLGKLALAPGFLPDFDFVNNNIMVAAEGDIVVVYYQDRQQLSVFRFGNMP